MVRLFRDPSADTQTPDELALRVFDSDGGRQTEHHSDFKNFDVTTFAQNFDGGARSVPADKKIGGGISEPQIFDTNLRRDLQRRGKFPRSAHKW
jgi:hypothetical protein